MRKNSSASRLFSGSRQIDQWKIEIHQISTMILASMKKLKLAVPSKHEHIMLNAVYGFLVITKDNLSGFTLAYYRRPGICIYSSNSKFTSDSAEFIQAMRTDLDDAVDELFEKHPAIMQDLKHFLRAGEVA